MKLAVAILVSLVATASIAGDNIWSHPNKICKIDIRGLPDKIAFKIDSYGNITNLKTFNNDDADNVTETIITKDGIPYTNPDGTCGLVDPFTNEKYAPFGYRQGILRDK